MANKLSALAELYLWNNFKFYLMTKRTCLCDNLLHIANASSDDPVVRYNDFSNALDQHIGLGSYVAGQAAQFSRFPYVTMTVVPLDRGDCSTRVVLTFDVAYGVDTPNNLTGQTGYPGNSSEAIATWKANICAALNEIMYSAFLDGNKHYSKQAFFDALRDTSWVNPITKEGNPKDWKYNIVGHVDESVEISGVFQLKKEDRSSGCLVFSVVYNLDINRLYGRDDCGC